MIKKIFLFTLLLLPWLASCNQDDCDNFDDLDTNSYHSYLTSNLSKVDTLIEVLNIRHTTQQNSLQSIVIDKNNKEYLIFNGTNSYFKYSFVGKYLGKFAKPITGHDNDAFILDKTIYINGSFAIGPEKDSKLLYKYKISESKAEQINIQDFTNKNSKCVIGGICHDGNNRVFIIAYNYRGSYNIEGDKLFVYEMDITSNEIKLIFETEWKGWFVQGATCINNFLYVTCNNLPINGHTFNGISIKVYNISTHKVIDTININGDFEPEGLDNMVENGIPYLYMGIAKYGYIGKIFKFKAPYY